MILLDSRFCGYDLDRIGFPSVETCMAVTLETKDWLVGWHAMNTGDTSLGNDATAFGGYVQRMGRSDAIMLYGVTHASRMGRDALTRQMSAIAAKIGYSGKVRFYLMPERRKSQQDYVEFVRLDGGMKTGVYYIDQQNVRHNEQQVAPEKTRHQVISGGAVRPITTSTIDDKTGATVTSATSPIRVSVDFQNHQKAKIADSDWTTFGV